MHLGCRSSSPTGHGFPATHSALTHTRAQQLLRLALPETRLNNVFVHNERVNNAASNANATHQHGSAKRHDAGGHAHAGHEQSHRIPGASRQRLPNKKNRCLDCRCPIRSHTGWFRCRLGQPRRHGVPQWQKAQGSHCLRKCFQPAGDESLGAECSHDDCSEGTSLWRALITRTLPRARLAQRLRQCQAIISEPDGCLHDSTWAWRTAVTSACRSMELFANDDSHGVVNHQSCTADPLVFIGKLDTPSASGQTRIPCSLLTAQALRTDAPTTFTDFWDIPERHDELEQLKPDAHHQTAAAHRTMTTPTNQSTLAKLCDKIDSLGALVRTLARSEDMEVCKNCIAGRCHNPNCTRIHPPNRGSPRDAQRPRHQRRRTAAVRAHPVPPVTTIPVTPPAPPVRTTATASEQDLAVQALAAVSAMSATNSLPTSVAPQARAAAVTSLPPTQPGDCTSPTIVHGSPPASPRVHAAAARTWTSADHLVENLRESTLEVLIRFEEGEFNDAPDSALAIAHAIDTAACEAATDAQQDDTSALGDEVNRILALIPDDPMVAQATTTSDQVVPTCASLVHPPATKHLAKGGHSRPPGKRPRLATSTDVTSQRRHATKSVITAPPMAPHGCANLCATHGPDFIRALASEHTTQQCLDAMLPASLDFCVRFAWDSELPHAAFHKFCSYLQENNYNHHCASILVPARHFTPSKQGRWVFSSIIINDNERLLKDRATISAHAHMKLSTCMADATNCPPTLRRATDAPMAVLHDSGSNVAATPHLSHLSDVKWHPTPKQIGLATSDTTTILAEGTSTIHPLDTEGTWHARTLQMSCVPAFPEPIL